jgi:hypothetical protein
MKKEVSWVKNAARWGLESPLGAPIRQAIVKQEARAEKAFVKRKAEEAGVKVFDPESFGKQLTDKPQADTFFILGSGSSINDLTAANFQEIGRHRSVGINNWPVHSFVPDLYSFDSVPWVGDGQNFRRSLDLLHRQDIVTSSPQVLIVRLKNQSEIDHIDTLPAELRSNVHFYGRVMPPTRRVSNLSADLRTALKILRHEHSGIVLDSGASMVRMVGIALALGYTKIVLVGVDLNNTRYFWEDNRLYPEGEAINSPVNNQGELLHETTDTWIRPFSVIDMMEKLANVVSDDYGGNIFIGSSQSALSSVLPVYSWHDSL